MVFWARFMRLRCYYSLYFSTFWQSLKPISDAEPRSRYLYSWLQLEFAFAPWFICDVFDDIDDSVWAWEALYKYIIDQHIPLRKAKVRSNSLPWMTSSQKKELNQRYNLLLKAQKTPRGSPKWLAFKKQRNYCPKLLKLAEISHLQQQTHQC